MGNSSSVEVSAHTAGAQTAAADAIHALEAARRIHDRLDWWRVGQWIDSSAWSVAGRDGAMLMVPADLEPDESLAANVHRHDAPGYEHAAWLRWCAIANGSSASGVMRALFQDSVKNLSTAHITSAWVIADGTDWLVPYLRDAGFERVDRMLTYEIDSRAAEHWTTAPGVDVCATTPADMDAIITVDSGVFDSPWAYGRLLHRAFVQCRVFLHAVVDGVLAGYACAVSDNARGHIVRLAVVSEFRRRGVGSALLAHCLRALRALGVTKVTLNTQHSNVVSQQMYQRLGFQPLIEQPSVLRLRVGLGPEAAL